MNIDDVVREWPGQTDGQVANSIFGSYGFSPADANTADDSPAHDPAQHTLFQRATDLQFLHGLAKRNGKICRVACAEKPGDPYRVLHPAVRGQRRAATISLLIPSPGTSTRSTWSGM